MARDRVDLYLDNAVSPGAPDVQLLPAIPNGETWRLVRFGGAMTFSGLVALQANIDGTWTTVRATAGPGQADDFEVNRDFTGNGTLRFRVVRQNLHTASQQLVAWLEAYKR